MRQAGAISGQAMSKVMRAVHPGMQEAEAQALFEYECARRGAERLMPRAGRPAKFERDALLAHAVVYGWGGIPVLWGGDELAQPNDPNWDTEPGHEADSRWAGRPRLDEGRLANRRDRSTVEGRVFTDLAHMAQVRAGLPQLDAVVRTRVDEGLGDGGTDAAGGAGDDRDLVLDLHRSAHQSHGPPAT